ncbi:MAG: alpha/beta hydrolase [Clostridiales bacterium]|nr:alpha/beta hydrolase [Clostridiales bacterium]MDY2730221.1 alpha/beta hydrolase [Clostridium sp.]NLK23940.1 alpha/beta hydrolase [Clostridiales bacterium]
MKSFWKVEINNKIINNNSNKLAVLLPGINYSTDRPLIDYSKRLALEMKYDCLAIDYGFQIARKEFDKDKEVNVIIKESIKILNEAIENTSKKYEEILLIGKSIGTVVQIHIQKEVCKNIKVKNIYLTPIENTFELGLSEESLVITGTNDTWISKETVEKIKNINNIKTLIIQNANHSLNIDGDILKTIEALNVIINEEKQYILNFN